METTNFELTNSMEDYLEMIYRLSITDGFTRINELADNLNVQPPSVTRMVQKLSSVGLVNYEKYGVVALTDMGKNMGRTLFKRHKIIEVFLKVLGVNDTIEADIEKMEHTLSDATLSCIVNYLSFLDQNPDISQRFKEFRDNRSI